MTTKENVRTKVITLLEDIKPHLIKKLDMLLDSGEIDFDDHEDNWQLPKEIMQALAREMEFQYSNHLASKADKKQITRYYHLMRTWIPIQDGTM